MLGSYVKLTQLRSSHSACRGKSTLSRRWRSRQNWVRLQSLPLVWSRTLLLIPMSERTIAGSVGYMNKRKKHVSMACSGLCVV